MISKVGDSIPRYLFRVLNMVLIIMKMMAPREFLGCLRSPETTQQGKTWGAKKVGKIHNSRTIINFRVFMLS